jgi:phosphodiesterase/alkaline phosphatase D-like protein
MNRQYVQAAITAATVSLLCSISIAGELSRYDAKQLPPASKASRVRISQGPALESADGTSAIITWTSNNPGGSDEHYGVVHYGTNPKKLDRIAKSHIRLNQNHAYTVFRVNVDGLSPQTTYFYRVTSEESSGTSDGVESAVEKFTTARSGQRIVASAKRD